MNSFHCVKCDYPGLLDEPYIFKAEKMTNGGMQMLIKCKNCNEYVRSVKLGQKNKKSKL